MAKNINSFAENMRRTVAAQTNTLNLLQSIQESLTTNEIFTTFDYSKLKNGETETLQLPSLTAIQNRLQAVETNLNNLSNGSGVITATDGTRRKIKVQTLASTPSRIYNVTKPTTFSVDPNWFFEDMMFPALQVSIDLTGQIDDAADRVKVARIILDSTSASAQQIWANNLSSNQYDYASLKTLLAYNNVSYSEDIQVVELPLVSNSLTGSFTVIADPKIYNGVTWYTFDTIEYKTIDEDGTDQGNNNILSPGDYLAYNDTLFVLTGVDQNLKMVKMQVVSGAAIPGLYTMFKYYQNPFREKKINVKFGANEYDFIYVKGVNEDYNLLANEWSVPITFDTNTLVLDTDANVTLKQYYQANVMDWGANMIAEAKERRLTAYYGHTPNAPTLNAADLRVVQINTQINAAMDTAKLKQTASEIENTKTLIESLKSTISAQKTELQSISSTDQYNAMVQQIKTNTEELSNNQVAYKSLVDTFKTAVKENEAVTETPKYHIRGFFPIPLYKYRDDAKTLPEQIIGFDIAYRYIKEDNTAQSLNTFSYTDTDGNSVVTGTFTDWIMTQSAIKQRVFNTTTMNYQWQTENVADGSEININQIDIAISKGEKVEIKVRSISEAGYPDNPLKSPWSNSIVISFPESLSTNNAIADLITEINDDSLQIAINNNLSSLGVPVHLDDSVANINSVNGLYYKHLSSNIAYERVNGSVTTTTTVQAALDEALKRIAALEAAQNQ